MDNNDFSTVYHWRSIQYFDGPSSAPMNGQTGQIYGAI